MAIIWRIFSKKQGREEIQNNVYVMQTGEKMNLESVINNFKHKGYTISHFATGKEAAAYIDSCIDGKTVGFGDSETMLSMGLYDLLSKHNDVKDPMHREDGRTFFQIAKDALTTEEFLTSVNAAAETGELVNIDGTGNRVAGSLFGHEKVWFVFSTQKIAPTVEAAIDRARNIAAPLNSARHGHKTPCAMKGDRCYDCASPDRICNALCIYEQKMRFIDMEIVLIDEPLGF